jgi:hypothetical protein
MAWNLVCVRGTVGGFCKIPVEARSGAESMSDFALSSEHFSFLSEKLSLFYQNLVSIHARD